ncbi:MAG: hypothetical protein ABSF94_15090 [Steroidobacteraceae bacterium]|jgi:hypothetical protein
MRAVIAWVMMICVAGCATMQTVTGSSLELQERIAAGELLQPGDHVRITTSDGSKHDLDVVSVTAYSINGKKDSVPVKDVFSVEKREGSIAGTVAVITVATIGALALIGLEAFKHGSAGGL